MRRITRPSALLAAVCLLVSPALADWTVPALPVHLNRISGYYTGQGGEFTMTPGAALAPRVVTGTFSDILDTNWQAICIERNEYVTVPGNYYGDLRTFSTGGGVGGQDDTLGPGGAPSDSLDPRTAYLFTEFRNGTLGGYDYDYGAGRPTSAGQLQNVVWFIENELGDGRYEVNDANAQALLVVGSQAYAWWLEADGAGWTDLGNVRVLTMWGDANHLRFHQDQLTMIPAPGAALLGMIGLGVVIRVRRWIL